MSGFTTRSWKGRPYQVVALDGLDSTDVEFFSIQTFMPQISHSKKLMWAYVNDVGLRMRCSEELIEAMILDALERTLRG